MGNNESLPPPPPPGQQPPVPPTPPPGPPAYTPPPQPYNPAPEYPPTQQMPPAQAYTPPTQAYPQQPYVQQGYNPNSSPPPKKNNTPLLIGGGIVAVAAIVGGVLLFTGDDDDKGSVAPGTTVSVSVETTVDSASTTVATETTVAPVTTLNITVPPVTDTPGTAGSDTTTPANGGVQTAFDDTNLFSMVLPAAFETLTDPITTDSGVSYSRIAGSENLAAYAEDDDTFGIFVLIGDVTQAGTANDVISKMDPGTDACPDGVNTTVETESWGTAQVLQLDGCGTGGQFAKVIMSAEIGNGLVMVAVAQGVGPANGSLQDFTTAVFETVQLV